MKNLYIVTSAIIIDGASSEDTSIRLAQTQHTIDSILSRDHNADIIIADSSHLPANGFTMSFLKRVNFISYTKDDRIHQIRREVKTLNMPVSEKVRGFYELGYIKNATESHVLCNVLKEIDHTKYQRIFKISGRYFYTDKFNMESRLNIGKFNVARLGNSPWPKNLTNCEHARSCVTWDYCTTLHDEVIKLFENIRGNIEYCSKNRMLTDIEHGLAKYLDDNIVNVLPEMGVAGQVNNEKSKGVYYG